MKDIKCKCREVTCPCGCGMSFDPKNYKTNTCPVHKEEFKNRWECPICLEVWKNGKPTQHGSPESYHGKKACICECHRKPHSLDENWYTPEQIEKLQPSDKEIMEKAIKKAQKANYKMPAWYETLIRATGNYGLEYDIIFSHDFTIKFWGEQRHNWGWDKPQCSFCGMTGTADVWEDPWCWSTNLKQMVLEENPYRYLERFLLIKPV